MKAALAPSLCLVTLNRDRSDAGDKMFELSLTRGQEKTESRCPLAVTNSYCPLVLGSVLRLGRDGTVLNVHPRG